MDFDPDLHSVISTLFIFLVPAEENDPCSLMLPLPYFSLWMVCSGWSRMLVLHVGQNVQLKSHLTWVHSSSCWLCPLHDLGKTLKMVLDSTIGFFFRLLSWVVNLSSKDLLATSLINALLYGLQVQVAGHTFVLLQFTNCSYSDRLKSSKWTPFFRWQNVSDKIRNFLFQQMVSVKNHLKEKRKSRVHWIKCSSNVIHDVIQVRR